MNKTWRWPRCCRYRMNKTLYLVGSCPTFPPVPPPPTQARYLGCRMIILYIWFGHECPPPFSSPGAQCLGYRMIRLYIWLGLAPPAALNPPHMKNITYFILNNSQSIPKTTEPLLLSLKDTNTKGSFTLQTGDSDRLKEW